jgi:hypothetical protein
MKGVKTWLSSQAADFFNTGAQKTVASIPAATMLRSSLSMYLFFVHNIFSRCFLTARRMLLSE